MKNSKTKKLIFIIFLISLVCFLLTWNWIFVNPFSPVSMEEMNKIVSMENGNVEVFTRKGNIYRISPDKKLIFYCPSIGKTIGEIRDVVINDNNDILMHDLIIDKGVRIKEERIIRLSPGGIFKKVELSFHPSFNAMTPKIVTLIPDGDGFIYAVKNKDGVYIRTDKGKQLARYSIPEAEQNVLSCAYDKKNKTLYYSTVDGRIIESDSKGNPKLIYSCVFEQDSVPREIQLKDQKLYCIDVGTREILILDVASKITRRLHIAEDPEDRNIDNAFDVTGEPVSISNAGVTWWEKPYTVISSVNLSLSAFIKALISYIALILLLITGLIQLIFFAIAFYKSRDYYSRSSILTVTVLAVLFCIIGTCAYHYFKYQITQDIYQRERIVAKFVKQAIPADSIRRIRKPAQFMGDDYKKIQNVLKSVFIYGPKSTEDLYCDIYKIINNKVVILCTLENDTILMPVDFDYSEETMQYILQNDIPINYIDEADKITGGYIYTLLPVANEFGNVEYFIEIGTDTGGFKRRDQKEMPEILLNGVALLALAFIMAKEILHFIEGIQQRKNESVINKQEELPEDITRFLIFVISFLVNTTCVVLPQYVFSLTPQGSPVSPYITAAIAVAITNFALLAARWFYYRKYEPSTTKTCAIACLLFVTGLVLRIFSSVIALILGNMFIGAGYALLLCLTENCAKKSIINKDLIQKATISGWCSGVIFGGFLAQWCNPKQLFIITTIIGTLMVYLFATYLSNRTRRMIVKPELVKPDHKFILVLFLFMVPFNLCRSFTIYTAPIFGEFLNMNYTHLCYMYVLGSGVAYILSKQIDKYFNKENMRKISLLLALFGSAGMYYLLYCFPNMITLKMAFIVFSLFWALNNYTFIYCIEGKDENTAIQYSFIYNTFEFIAIGSSPLIAAIFISGGFKQGFFGLTFIPLIGAVLLAFTLKEKKTGI